ncbi:MAG: hypothetical protein V7704_03095 [Aurantimonas endophytica]|uniref:hypothetical protein n=1 Tax=Aurantimonas endophytica TaxID=1522175 RepID=UPI003003782E
MTLTRTLSAALVASATVILAAPAQAIVPGSEHYADRRDETARDAVAEATAMLGEAEPRQRPAFGASGNTTFGYATGPRVKAAPPIRNEHYRDRADETSRAKIQAR